MLELSRRAGAGDGEERLRRLAEQVPGFAGYAQKESRQDADLRLRTHVANRLQTQADILADMQRGLEAALVYDKLAAVEAALVRLQSLADEVRAAGFGVAGWLEEGSVDEAELGRLYTFDLSLAEGADFVETHVAEMVSATADENAEAFQAAVDDLNATLDRLAARTVERRNLVSETQRPNNPLSPGRLLDAARAALGQDPTLPELRIDDVVSYQGTDYTIGGGVTYHHSGQSWQAYALQSAEVRWLWVVDGGRELLLATQVPTPEAMDGKTSLDWQGETLRVVDTGRATADVDFAGGRRSGVALEYWRLAGDSGRIMWLERQGEELAAFLGEPVQPSQLEVWQRTRSDEG